MIFISRARLNQMIDQRVALRTAELERHLKAVEELTTLLGDRVSAVEDTFQENS